MRKMSQPGPKQTACLIFIVTLLSCYPPSLRGQLPGAASSTSPGSTPPGKTLPRAASTKTRIILDTDIGDDVDDAFALALALSSPEINIAGITTACGDTHLRARLVDRFLAETQHQGLAVAEGIPTR